MKAAQVLTQEGFNEAMKALVPRYKEWPQGEAECFVSDVQGFIMSDRRRYKSLRRVGREKMAYNGILGSLMWTFFRMAEEMNCHFLAFFGILGPDAEYEAPETPCFRDVLWKFLRANGLTPADFKKLISKAKYADAPQVESMNLLYLRKKDVTVLKFLDVARILGVTPPALACYYFYDFVLTEDVKERLGINFPRN